MEQEPVSKLNIIINDKPFQNQQEVRRNELPLLMLMTQQMILEN